MNKGKYCFIIVLGIMLMTSYTKRKLKKHLSTIILGIFIFIASAILKVMLYLNKVYTKNKYSGYNF